MAVITRPVAEDLRTLMRGAVHLRGEAGYAAEVEGFNLLSPTRPDLVVVPEDEADVQAAVRWAAAHAQTVHPQLTGHGAYRALEHGMLLKTSRLTHLRVDADRASWTMGAGLRWMDILPELHRHGLGAVTGSARTVGAVGLILGGGIGPLGLTLGMASDWARAFRVVDGRGDVLVASPTENTDLFWALRGGKVGLGVVTEMTVAAPRTPFVYGGGLFYGAADIHRVTHAWLDWVRDIPDSVNTSIAILRLPPEVPVIGGSAVLHVRYAYVEPGASTDELAEGGEALLAGWRELAGPTILDTVGVLPSDRLGEIHSEPEGPIPVWEWGDFLEDIDHDFIDTLLSHVGAAREAPLATVEIRLQGGAIVREPAVPSAVGGKAQPFTLLVLGMPSDELAPWEVVEAAGHAIRDDVAGYSGAQINYNWANHPSSDTFRTRLWSQEASDRLRNVRAAVDPDGVFEHGN